MHSSWDCWSVTGDAEDIADVAATFIASVINRQDNIWKI